MLLHESYVIDEKDRKTAVVISLNEWERVQEMLEDYEDIRAYDAAKSKSSEPMPLKNVIKKLRK